MADEYALNFPFQPEAMFWSIFVRLRLREPEAYERLEQAQSRWGDRPYTLALRLMAMAIQHNRAKVFELVSHAESGVAKEYSLEEQGALDLAIAYALQPYGDYKWKNYLTAAKSKFYPARLHWRILPFLPPPKDLSVRRVKFTR